MQFTYENKETGQVVKRDEEWSAAEDSEDWVRVDNSVDADGEAEGGALPEEHVEKQTPDPEEAAGGSPAEDVGDPQSPGVIGDLEELSRAELNDVAASRGIEGVEDLPNKAAAVEAIRAATDKAEPEKGAHGAEVAEAAEAGVEPADVEEPEAAEAEEPEAEGKD